LVSRLALPNRAEVVKFVEECWQRFRANSQVILPLKLIYLLIVGLLATQASGQGFEALDDVVWADRIKPQPGDFRVFSVDVTRDYTVKDEGGVLPVLDGEYVVTADLVVNDDPASILRESRAVLQQDTLHIWITRFDSSSDHNFQIQIIKDKCFVFYDYSRPMDEENRKMRTISFALTLSSNKFRKGDKIQGHVTYIGQCTTYCDDWLPKQFEIEGYFATTIE
jgi:hypothetical protein